MDVEGLTELGRGLNRPITGIVHGAGLEDSKLVAAKDYDVFDRVVRKLLSMDGIPCLLLLMHREANCDLHPASPVFQDDLETTVRPIIPPQTAFLMLKWLDLHASGSCRAVAVAWTGWRDVAQREVLSKQCLMLRVSTQSRLTEG